MQEKFECQTCGKIFRGSLNLKACKTTHLSKKECNICGEFLLRKYLKYHQSRHGKKLFRCEKCDKTLHTKRDLIEHAKIHQKLFSCDKYDKKISTSQTSISFTWKWNLPVSIVTDTKLIEIYRKEPRDIKCKMCNFIAPSNFVMTGHWNTVWFRRWRHRC
jgi:uncharacterized C2H2 Zn-finger protein